MRGEGESGGLLGKVPEVFAPHSLFSSLITHGDSCANCECSGQGAECGYISTSLSLCELRDLAASVLTRESFTLPYHRLT